VLPLLWFTVIIVAPFDEEVTFRGFLYRGWVRTERGVVPGILVISALWAVIHIQYDWFGILQVFLLGLFFGWARWWSGSASLTFLLHAGTNLWAMVETAVGLQASP
jgi:CAAX protease family protein